MKFTFAPLLLASLAAVAFGATQQKAIVVSYPSDTPESVIAQTKDAIKAAVCHPYSGVSTLKPTP